MMIIITTYHHHWYNIINIMNITSIIPLKVFRSWWSILRGAVTERYVGLHLECPHCTDLVTWVFSPFSHNSRFLGNQLCCLPFFLPNFCYVGHISEVWFQWNMVYLGGKTWDNLLSFTAPNEPSVNPCHWRKRLSALSFVLMGLCKVPWGGKAFFFFLGWGWVDEWINHLQGTINHWFSLIRPYEAVVSASYQGGGFRSFDPYFPKPVEPP